MDLMRNMRSEGVNVRWNGLTAGEEGLLSELVHVIKPYAMAKIAAATTAAAVASGKPKAHHVKAYLGTWCQHAPTQAPGLAAAAEGFLPAAPEIAPGTAPWDLPAGHPGRTGTPLLCHLHPGAPEDHSAAPGQPRCLTCNTERLRSETQFCECGNTPALGHAQCGRCLGWGRCPRCVVCRVDPATGLDICGDCVQDQQERATESPAPYTASPLIISQRSTSEDLIDLSPGSWPTASSTDPAF
ncbi:hypothetical protein DBP12_03090 [Streptomyces sp. CS014]|nr:hypothetical protein DBP12_03090 [Streptomyces sp. CS014]